MGLKEYIFGFDAEIKACKYLEKNGYEILDRNFHSRFGEIDIIAKKDEILHFIEAKATNGDYEAIYRINQKKIEKIIKTINFYLIKKELSLNYQIDAILVQKNKISLIENITY